jgi:hypothetical protein
MLSDSVMELGLSKKGLGNLRENVFEQDFTFIVGNDRWQCASFIAAFLSPRIAAFQGSDHTLHEFTITTNDLCHYFKSFLFLGFGSTVTIASTHSIFFDQFVVNYGIKNYMIDYLTALKVISRMITYFIN